MANNPNTNGGAGGQYYRRQIYAQSTATTPTPPGNLPPASELLSQSPTLSYPNKVRHPMHSVASPNLGPPSPYLSTGHNSYQALTEPGTPAFLPTSVDPTPSPSYESIASPASNNHVNQSAGSTKPSTPMAECRGSPIPNGIYNAPNQHYTAPPHYYPQPHQQYQRLPSVDTLPSPSSFYPNNSSQMPPPNQPTAHHSNVYIRPLPHPANPNAYMPPTTPNAEMYPSGEEMNGIQDYYPDPYAQPPPNDSNPNYMGQIMPQQQYARVYPSTVVMKQPGPQPLQRTPNLQRQIVYQQPQYPGAPPHQVNIYDGTVVEQRPTPVPYVPSQMGMASNGTNVHPQQKVMSDGTLINATQSPIMSTPSITIQPADETKQEKPKKPPPKRNRKTAAQLKAEAAAKATAEQQEASLEQTEELTQQSVTGQKANGDSDTSMMPPPKVDKAPSVIAAAKAMHNAVTSSNNTTPQKPEQKPSPQQLAQSPVSTYESTQLGATVNDLPTQQTPQQATGPPKRQRTASQRAQQQKARIQKQKELEALKLREEREYMVKFAQLRRTVRALVFKNGALADEVARLKMQIDVCREERKMVAKRVQHYERNRIRRLQTHERKAQAKAAAAQLQAEQKSTETTEEDDNSKSIDVVLPLNDVRSAQIKQMPINFQSMQDSGFFQNAAESAPPKSRTPTQTPRKRSRSSKEPGEQAPAKRRKSNGTASTTPVSTTPMETSPSPSQKQLTPVQQPVVQPVISETAPLTPAEKSHSPSPTAKLAKRPVGRPEKRTPPITSTAAEDALLLRTRTVSTSLPATTNTPTTPSRPEFTRFPTNFLERAETPADKLEEPKESEYDRMSIDHQTPASKLSNDRHLRSNSSTMDGGVGTEIRQRANSRTSRRPPRHSLTPSSMADSCDVPSNSASPVPTSTEGTPTNTPTVVTRRRAAEIATSSTTPPMKTRSKTKHSS